MEGENTTFLYCCSCRYVRKLIIGELFQLVPRIIIKKLQLLNCTHIVEITKIFLTQIFILFFFFFKFQSINKFGDHFH